MVIKGYKRVFQKILKDQLSLFLFVSVLFIVGVVFGAIIVNSLGIDQKHDLYSYLSKFFTEISSGKVVPSKEHLIYSYQENLKVFLLIWILGISVIGVPLILILLFVRGIVVGFTVGFLVNQGGVKGFLLACVTVLPHNFLLIPLLIFVTSCAILISMKMIKRQFLKEENESIASYLKFYSATLVLGLMILLVASVIEVYVSPLFMQMITTYM